MNQYIDPAATPSSAGCIDCDRDGSWWVHLRRCAECGHVGCCDDSLNRHATAHFRETGHRIIQSFEPAEDWFWDYAANQYAEGPVLADPQSHPGEQTVPGPADRVPRGWEDILARRARTT